MRVASVVLACLACTGHGRRVLMRGQGPMYQAGSIRAGGRDPKGSLASIFRVRGGEDDPTVWKSLGPSENFREKHTRRPDSALFGDLGGGGSLARRTRSYVTELDGVRATRGGYADLSPYRSSRPRGAFRTRDVLDDEDLDDFIDPYGTELDGRRQAAGTGFVYEPGNVRRIPRGSVESMKPSRTFLHRLRNRRARAEVVDLDDDSGDMYEVRRYPHAYAGQFRNSYYEDDDDDIEEFRERRYTRRPRTSAFGATRGGRYADSASYRTENFRDRYFEDSDDLMY